jgi:hypothetical protein
VIISTHTIYQAALADVPVKPEEYKSPGKHVESNSPMNAIGRHAVLSAIALLLGVALVLWVRPDTADGRIFLIAIVVAAINAIGAVVWRVPKVAWIALAPLLLGQSGCPPFESASGTVTGIGNGGGIVELSGPVTGGPGGAAITDPGTGV